MHIFRRKSVVLALIVISLLAMLAIAARSSLQSADAGTGNVIQKRNAQLKEAFRLAEGR
jgi:hypothetical protein